MNVFANLYLIFFGSSVDLTIIGVIIFRTVFMYFYTLLNVRLMDRRSTGLLSPFDIMVVVILGDVIGSPMYGDKPLFHAMVVITTIVFIERIISRITVKNMTLERAVNGQPILLIKQGVPQHKELIKQSISNDELASLLRLHGLETVRDVELAYLEPNGSISVIKKQKSNDDENELGPTKL